MQAKDIMTTTIVSIDPACSIRHALHLMLDTGVSCLPVVEDVDRLCGILTEDDLFTRKEVDANLPDKAEPVKDLNQYIHSRSWCVGDAMTCDVVTAAPDAPISSIIGLMQQHHVRQIPIVRENRLVGIVNRRDVFRTIVNSAQDVIAAGDDAVRLAIKTRLRSDLGLDCDKIDITVENSQVAIAGGVRSELERKAIKVLVEDIRGIGGFIDRMHVTGGHA